MAVRILPAKMKRILPEEEYNRVYSDLGNLNISRRKDGYNPKVEYYLNKKRYAGSCFSSIYKSEQIWRKNTILKINLFIKNQRRLKTRYGNILKYFRHLSKLYSGLTFKTEVDNKGELWVVIKNSKDYPNTVLRDITTRVRFLFEGDAINTHMDDLLSQKKFHLNSIEELISSKDPYYIQIGHWLFRNNKPENIIDYTNYEERFLEECNKYKKEESYWPDLNTITAKLLKNNE
jgi:hypothetical protein